MVGKIKKERVRIKEIKFNIGKFLNFSGSKHANEKEFADASTIAGYIGALCKIYMLKIIGSRWKSYF